MVIKIIKKFSDYKNLVVDHPLYKHETTKVPTAVGRIMSGPLALNNTWRQCLKELSMFARRKYR